MNGMVGDSFESAKCDPVEGLTCRLSKVRSRKPISLVAVVVVKVGSMLNAFVASAFGISVVNVAAQQPPSCTVAINAIAGTLPELVSTGSGYEWRRLVVTFDCDTNGSINGATIRWHAGRAGLLIDARSAITWIGARLTGDTANAVRAALDRCVTLALTTRKTSDAIASRSVVTCTVSDTSALFMVQKRLDR